MSYQSQIKKLKDKHRDNFKQKWRVFDAQKMLTSINHLGSKCTGGHSMHTYDDLKKALKFIEES
jgi:hypothetical protein